MAQLKMGKIGERQKITTLLRYDEELS